MLVNMLRKAQEGVNNGGLVGCVVITWLILGRVAWSEEAQNKKAPLSNAKKNYTAQAFFRVSMAPENLFGPKQRYNEMEFNIFKNTQKQLLKSKWVLGTALRNSELNQLGVTGFPLLRKAFI